MIILTSFCLARLSAISFSLPSVTFFQLSFFHTFHQMFFLIRRTSSSSNLQIALVRYFLPICYSVQEIIKIYQLLINLSPFCNPLTFTDWIIRCSVWIPGHFPSPFPPFPISFLIFVRQFDHHSINYSIARYSILAILPLFPDWICWYLIHQLTFKVLIYLSSNRFFHSPKQISSLNNSSPFNQNSAISRLTLQSRHLTNFSTKLSICLFH